MNQKSLLGAVQAAKFILQERFKEGLPTSNLEAQALLFFCQRDCLRQRGHPLFGEDILAYPFGPAVAEVYSNFCGYGAKKIITFWPSVDVPLDAAEIIHGTLLQHKDKSSLWLLAASRRTGGAWQRTFSGGIGRHATILPQFIERFG